MLEQDVGGREQDQDLRTGLEDGSLGQPGGHESVHEM